MKFKRSGGKWSEEEKQAFSEKLANEREKDSVAKGILVVILPSDEFMKWLNEKGIGLKIDKEVKYFEKCPDITRSVAVFGYKLGSYKGKFGSYLFFRSDDKKLFGSHSQQVSPDNIF